MSVLLYSKKTWGICKCGHYAWQHDDSIPDNDLPPKLWKRAEGHGGCGHNEDINNPFADSCPCEQFTWVKTVPASYLRPSCQTVIDDE